MALGRVLVIFNPEAKHGETSKLVPVIEQLLMNVHHDSVLTEFPGHAEDLAAAADGYDVVVAVGG
ncbi:MAG TPA: diacylglycerol kinase family protein, partial [Coriobacteriia bacterium]|nr:diacylglycerol kinase family protein [Coriobacteriia bacterium]